MWRSTLKVAWWMRALRAVGAFVIGAGLVGTAVAATIPEAEVNDSFSQAQIIPAGVTGVAGALDDVTPSPDYTFTDSLEGNSDADYFDITGVSPNVEFVAWTDNSASGVDTVLGWFDHGGTVLGTDDDSSPVGDGLASALAGYADSYGEIHIGVTGFPDFFDGNPHDETGEYTLNVAVGKSTWADVDYYAFVDLPPGGRFVAETFPRNQSDIDTMLGLFDAAGDMVDFNDDWTGLFSRLEGVVPANGTLWLAVTGYPDWDFRGWHSEGGDYLLTVTVQPVPEPSTLVLLGTGLAGAWFGRRRGRCRPYPRP